MSLWTTGRSASGVIDVDFLGPEETQAEESGRAVGEPTRPIPAARKRRDIPRTIEAVLALQLVTLIIWCWWVYDTWNVHVDFATRSEAVYGILHGDWNPFYTVMGWSHLADHFDLSLYPTAFLTELWPHLMWLFIIQALLVVAAEYGVLRIIVVLSSRSWWPSRMPRRQAMGVLVALYVCNPFLFWAVVSDPHFHMFGAMCGVVWTLYFFFRRSWGWMAAAVGLTVLFGDLAAQFLIVLGVSIALISLRDRGGRNIGLLVALCGLVWSGVAIAGGAGSGSELGIHYGYLTNTSKLQVPVTAVASGLASHPLRAVSRVPDAMASMWGYVSIGGVLGLFTPLSLPVALNAVEAGLGVQAWVGWPYSSAGSMAEMPWQMFPMLLLEPLFTLIALAWLQRPLGRWRRQVRRITPLALLLLVVNGLVWFVVWMPWVVNSINLTPPSTVAVLNQVAAEVPSANEVVASIGVIGRLGDRQYIYDDVFGSANTVVPLRTPHVDFVITPVTGQESNAVDLEALTSYLLQQPNAQLMLHRQNVWLFDYTRLPGQHQFVMHYNSVGVVGAALPTTSSSRPPNVGWPQRNCLWSGARSGGYLFTQYRNALAPGSYVLRMTVAGTAAMTVKVGDDDSHLLLASGHIRVQPGLRTVALPFTVTSWGMIPVTHGWGPYRLSFPIPQRNDMIETRLWSAGGPRRAVCDVSVLPRL